ncbi:MAG: homoserine O-succinyltransferase [Candidatus Calescibacterium sp.]|nr:homoserine O-succinyltransferase [Candidatus Calescibacterium sp.]MCX7733987.1 homoserine O-succinyltransferase [bacterium]MDW8086414.1 homoserine O-succinyltransferase [Candidatus Calescibacterium sp.]
MKEILAVRHVEIEGLGEFEEILNEIGLKFLYLDVWKNDIEKSQLKNFDGFIILGGYMGVYEYERYPFLKNSFLVAEYSLETEKPIMGICLGSQILAYVLGARVFKGHKKEIGWYDVFKTGEHKLFDDFPQRFTAFHWHGDTFDLPKGAQRVFSSSLYENQTFVFGKAVGIQFHLEVGKKMIKHWAEEYEKELADEGISTENLKNQKDEVFDNLKKLSKNLLNKIFK